MDTEAKFWKIDISSLSNKERSRAVISGALVGYGLIELFNSISLANNSDLEVATLVIGSLVAAYDVWEMLVVNHSGSSEDSGLNLNT